MQSSPPTPPTPPAGGPKPHRSAATRLYEIQVRAFLEAAEMVDTEPEVIEDLLDGFPADESGEDDPDGQDGDVDVTDDSEGIKLDVNKPFDEFCVGCQLVQGKKRKAYALRPMAKL